MFPELQPMYAAACLSPCVSEDNLVWLNAQLQSMSPQCSQYVGTAPGVGLVGSIRGSYDSIFAGASLAPRRRIFAIKPKGIPIHPDILVSIYHYESGIGRWKA